MVSGLYLFALYLVACSFTGSSIHKAREQTWAAIKWQRVVSVGAGRGGAGGMHDVAGSPLAPDVASTTLI